MADGERDIVEHAHLPEGAIVLFLALLPQERERRHLDDRQAEQRNPLAERDGERGEAAE